jgi:hypothetical protein
MRLIILMLLLTVPVWCAPHGWDLKAGHRKALLGTGLPLYTLPESAGVTYRKATLEFSPDSRYYQLDYMAPDGQGIGDPTVYCSNRRYALTNVGKPLETQQILAGSFGSLTVSRYQKVCRTGWLRRNGAWVQIEAECENLARFGQLLEQFRVTPGRPRRAARQEAIRATGLDLYEVPGLPVKLTTIEFDPYRNWNNYASPTRRELLNSLRTALRAASATWAPALSTLPGARPRCVQANCASPCAWPRPATSKASRWSAIPNGAGSPKVTCTCAVRAAILTPSATGCPSCARRRRNYQPIVP